MKIGGYEVNDYNGVREISVFRDEPGAATIAVALNGNVLFINCDGLTWTPDMVMRLEGALALTRSRHGISKESEDAP